jgi:hypothetical protein
MDTKANSVDSLTAPTNEVWRSGKPPNEVVVEVKDRNGRALRARAIWGRDGVLPHWESEDRDTLWRPSEFRLWRPV